ncbi:MAG: hypothetical protein ABGW98_05070, partial [Myxococcales bacterium]
MTISAVTRDVVAAVLGRDWGVGVVGGFAGAWLPFCAQGLKIVIGSHCNRVSGGGAGAMGARLGMRNRLIPRRLT